MNGTGDHNLNKMGEMKKDKHHVSHVEFRKRKDTKVKWGLLGMWKWKRGSGHIEGVEYNQSTLYACMKMS
jgi:hypothetical protein